MDWNKFKQMSLSRKIQWVIQYYGLTIAVVAAVVIVGTVFLKSVFGPADTYAIRVMILDDRQSADICRDFSEELSTILSGECDITSYLESETYQMQAFVVRLITDDLDLVIAPEHVVVQMVENGYFIRAMKLEEDSYYYEATGRNTAEEEEAIYIGEPRSSQNTENIPAAMDYFVNGAK